MGTELSTQVIKRSIAAASSLLGISLAISASSISPAQAKAPAKPPVKGKVKGGQAAAQASGHVQWYSDFHQGLKAAVAERKWLFVVVETTWCGVCKSMDTNILPQPQVQAALKKSFICVRIDGDRPYGEAMLKQYGFTGVPSLFVFEPSGALRGKICGGANDAESFLSMLSAMVAGEGR